MNIPTTWPLPEDSEVEDLPVAGKFFRYPREDGTYAVVLIGKDYEKMELDGSMSVGKYVADKADCRVVLVKGTTVEPVEGVGWIGFTRIDGTKTIEATVALYEKNAKDIVENLPFDNLFIKDTTSNKVTSFTDMRLEVGPSIDNEAPLFITMWATDDPTLIDSGKTNE